MAPWQVLRAGKATQAALGYRVHHGPGGSVHYSTAAAAAAAPDSSSRSFCLSREKATMQQLNRRLATYLQQVQCLEAANQKLESLIQKELDRKCPRELRELDRHLRTVSLLQDQISDRLCAQAQVKLQLLSAELTIFDFNVRCEKERERRGCLEAELSDLRLLEEELNVHRLPELQSLLNDQTQELTELQIQHQQNMQGLLAHMSGGVTVEMQPAESSDLIQQLDDLRQTSVSLLDKNQNEHWFNVQVPMLSCPEVTFDPPAGSEVIQAELEEVRSRAAILEEELTQLQCVNMVLEASGREQNESFVQQLVVLQQRADSLCNDLDSVLQAAAQQAADYQNLLDVKTRLESEIQDYMRLLDGLSPQGVSSLHPNSAANITSLCVPTSSSAFRRNITVNKTAHLQGGNFRMMEVQDVSRGHICAVGKPAVVAPLSETVTTVQSIRVQQSKHAKSSPVTSVNTSNVTGSFHKSEKQRMRAPSEMTGKGSMSLSVSINRQGSPVEDKVHTEYQDLKKSSIVSTQISQGLDKEASNLETNTAKGTTMSVSAAVETKQEAFTSKQTTTEVGLQANKTKTIIQTVITKTIPCVEPEVKQGQNFVAHVTTTDPKNQTAAKVKKETETVISAQMNHTEGSIQTKNKDPAQVASSSLETQAEAVQVAGNIAITASVDSGALILRSEEAQGKVSGDLTLMADKNIEIQEKQRGEKVGCILPVLKLDQSSAVSDASNSKQNKVKEDADTRSGIVTAFTSSPESNDNLKSKTAQGIITLVPDTKSVRSADVQEKPVSFTSNQTATEAGVKANKTETNLHKVITKTIPCAEPEVKQGLNFVAHTTTDPKNQTAAKVKKETETVISAQMNHTDGSIQTKNKDPAQVASSSLETQAEAVQDAGNVAITASVVSGSHILRSEEAKNKVTGDLTLMDNKNTERQEKNREGEGVKGTLTVLRLDQSTELHNAPKNYQNKVMEDTDTGSDIVTASSSSPDRNDNIQSKTAQGIITLVPDTKSSRSADVQAKPETFTSSQTTTEAGLQASKTETNIHTVITKTIPCVEPEVKQRPSFVAHLTTTEPIRQTAVEVKKETETVISAPINCTEGNCTVSSSLETQAETVKDAGNLAITASVDSRSHILSSEKAQGKVSGDLTLMADKNIEIQEKKRGEKVGCILPVLKLDQSSAVSDASNSKQNKVKEDADTRSGIITASTSSPESNDNLKSKTAQGIITLIPDTKSVRSADVQEKPVSFTSNQTATEAGVKANKTETNLHKVITKTIPCAEPEEKQGPNFVAHTTTTDLGKQSAAEENKKTETAISAQMHHTEGSIQDKHQDPAQIVSLHLETQAEAVKDTGEVAVEASVVSGSHILSSEEAQDKAAGDLTLIEDKDMEKQERKGEEKVVEVEGTLPVVGLDQSLEFSDASNSKQNKVMEDAGTESSIATASSGSPDSNDTFESKTANTENLRKVELVEKEKLVSSFHNTKEEKVDPTELDKEMVILVGQEELLSTTESKKSTRRTDSGVALSSSNSEGLLSPREDHVFATTTETVECLSPEICLSPVETEVLMSMTDRVFRPVDLEERVLSPSDSGTCLSPVETKMCLSPNGDEEDEEVGLSLTEANAHVRPVERYILSTKEEGQSLSFSRAQALPEVDRNEKVSVSVRGAESLCFGSLESDKGSRGTVNGTSHFKPTSQGMGLEMSSSGMARDVAASSGGTDASSSGTVSSNTEASGIQGRFRHDSGEWKVYQGSLGHLSVSLPNTGSKESPSGATLPATSQKETGRLSNRGSGEWMVYGGSLGRKSSLPRTKSEESPSAAMLLATSPPETRFGSRGSGVVYSSSPKRTSILAGNDRKTNTESRESLPTVLHRATSPPGTGKFGSRGSGEWRVYGGSTGRISSWAGSDNLPTADGKGNPSMATQLPTSPPGSIGAGKFGSRGSGEWKVYGGSTGRISSWAGSDNLPTADKGDNPSMAAQLPISPPGSIGAGKFGSRGSGEWRVYGGSTGRISSWAGSDNLPTADREENPSVAAHLPISPPGSVGAGRFGSGGSGEWRVYGGSTGRLSRASNPDRVSVGEHRNRMISPPSSYTSSGLRLSSGGSSGRLGSGSVVRRSSSVGSGGRLSSSGSGGRLSSSSGSHRMSTSGRFSSTASGEYKPVYSLASGRKSSAGSAGQSGSSQRAPSPGGRMSASMGGGGWLSSSTAGGTCNSSSGSGSKLSNAGGSDRVSSRTGGRISSSSGSGRTNSTGGRIISSSDRPIRSTGSGAGGNKERISVCKMAALSMSKAGRERSEDRQRQAQWRQQQQQQTAGTSPLLQRWLTSGSDVKSANPEGLDDIMHL